jgi:hypothetical protein
MWRKKQLFVAQQSPQPDIMRFDHLTSGQNDAVRRASWRFVTVVERLVTVIVRLLPLSWRAL